MPQHDRLPVRRSRFDDTPVRRQRHRFDDELDDQGPTAPRRRTPDPAPPDDGPATGDRWSTWDIAQHGPEPHPGWLVTELAAVDTELGVLKTGKEADVHLIQRAVPGRRVRRAGPAVAPGRPGALPSATGWHRAAAGVPR